MWGGDEVVTNALLPPDDAGGGPVFGGVFSIGETARTDPGSPGPQQLSVRSFGRSGWPPTTRRRHHRSACKRPICHGPAAYCMRIWWSVEQLQGTADRLTPTDLPRLLLELLRLGPPTVPITIDV